MSTKIITCFWINQAFFSEADREKEASLNEKKLKEFEEKIQIFSKDQSNFKIQYLQSSSSIKDAPLDPIKSITHLTAVIEW